MRLGISGSRNWPASKRRELCAAFMVVYDKLKPEGFEIGDASGVDSILYTFLKQNNQDVNRHFSYWAKLGKSAGPERNGRILQNSEALVAFPVGDSRGTWNCIRQAMAKDIPVYIYENGMWRNDNGSSD